MKPDFFTHLPSEIITNILSRLSVRSIAISKCICRSWLHLLETDDFVSAHLSQSAPALAVMMPLMETNWCRVFELEDELDLNLDPDPDPLTKFDFPDGAKIKGSANGLLFLNNLDADVDILYICNPVTREFIALHSLPKGDVYGFGVSKISGQHKVVCINPKSDCHVYTLGTGSWRRGEASSFRYECRSFGALVNGNLHWVVVSLEALDLDKQCISCFDVEKECFSTFPAPPLENGRLVGDLFTLKDCLCACDESSGTQLVIWLVKEYEQVEKCWSKEYVITRNLDHGVDVLELAHPIKVFKNGDILMLCDAQIFIYYCNETKTTHEVGGLFRAHPDCYCLTSMLLTPSFLSLRSLGMENIYRLEF